MSTPAPDVESTRIEGGIDTPVDTPAANTGEFNIDLDETMQDATETGEAAAPTNEDSVNDESFFDDNDNGREELELYSTDSDPDNESDVEEIEIRRPVKKIARHALPDELPGSSGGLAHRKYKQRMDKLMNSRVADSNDEDDEFIPAGTYAAYRFNGPDKDLASKKSWNRQDALLGLDVEFWLCHPDHTAGDPAKFDCPSADSSHPEYDLYLRIKRLINEYYDGIGENENDDDIADIDNPVAGHGKGTLSTGGKGKEPARPKREKTKGESNLVRKTKNRVRDAVKAYTHGGYGNSRGNKKWYTDYLPDQAELMFPRFVDPYGATNGTISGHLNIMHRSWMLEIGGRPATGVSSNQAKIDDNMSAVAANAAATSISTSKELADLKNTVNNLGTQMVKKIKEMDKDQQRTIKKVNEIDEHTGNMHDELGNQAVKIIAFEGTKKAVEKYNKTIANLDEVVKKLVAAEVKKHLAVASQPSTTIRKPKPTPVMEDPTDKRTPPGPRNPASRSTTAPVTAKTPKKRTTGSNKAATNAGEDEIDLNGNFFD
ncbi:hypothetical protein CEP54_015432 [Fusarium duplospermum]|uniref:Uncharacterized protein n=1 Tax=Fusarium duplospermum TaxID=1325734 RepID=A0A428NP63_9HYPO|nr:hypothetical protein CEP54_015432 [Fusarium duplospermum]